VRRLRNHAALAAASSAGTVLIFAAIRSTDAMFRASMATAYVGLVLLAVTLAFGPVAAFRGRRYPVTTDLRRDVGIWAAVASIAHVVIGLQVHLRGKMWEYFVHSVRGTFLPRIDPFGAANYSGAAATLLLVALLATSNDLAFRRLGARRWRTLHKLVEWMLVLTILHGAIYQFVEKRDWAAIIGFMVIATLVIAVRVLGRRVR
jgi:methionine sulfoxide reductase heme-binding subunit